MREKVYKFRYITLAAVVALAVAAGYANIVSAFFASDDFERIAEARNGSFSYFVTAWDGTTGRPAYYRPLIVQTYALDYALWGLRPFPYHLVNLFLHWLASLLVSLLTIEFLTGAGADHRAAFLPGAATGVAFAAAIRHTEAVSWISGRADVAAAVLSLAAILVYVRFRPAEGRTRHLIWAAAPCGQRGIWMLDTGCCWQVTDTMPAQVARRARQGCWRTAGRR